MKTTLLAALLGVSLFLGGCSQSLSSGGFHHPVVTDDDIVLVKRTPRTTVEANAAVHALGNQKL